MAELPILYDMALSGNCYKVRLFCALTDIGYQSQLVNLQKLENQTAEYLAINALGQIPAWRDDAITLRDSQAILIYLARSHQLESWFPPDPVAQAEVMMWMFTAANEMMHGPAYARAVVKFGRDYDLKAAQEIAHQVISVLDDHLSNRDWLALDRPTIADIACFPYVALAPEGEIALADFPNVRKWIERVKALPGFIVMEGIQ